jgi:hypothetical protein
VLDSSGNPLQALVTARIVSGSTTFASTSSRTAVDGTLGLTAAGEPPPGCYEAQIASLTAAGYLWNGQAPSATFCVKPKAAVVSISLGPSPRGHLHAQAAIAAQGSHPIQGRVVVAVLRGAATYASTAGRTTPSGVFGVTTGGLAPPGCYQARVESLSAPGYTWDGSGPTATYCVPPPAGITLLTLTRLHRRLHLELRLASGATALRGRVSVAILHGSSIFASGAGLTGADGRFGLTAGRRPPRGCYTARVRSVSVHGTAWDRKAPVARLCIR